MTTRLRVKSAQFSRWGQVRHEVWLLGSLVILPYASYLGLLGAIVLLLGWLSSGAQDIWHRLSRQGWIWLMLCMGISITLAEDPMQAALQAMNFWPFFLFFAGLSTYITRLARPLQHLEQWAFWLLMASVPINVRAFLEYLPALTARLSSPLGATGIGPIYQRVDSVFGNPNVLAAYLVIIFGLGLGLCLQSLPTSSEVRATAQDRRFLTPEPTALPLKRPQFAAKTLWMCAAMALIPLGVLCSGSRSGVMVLLVQLLVAISLVRRHRWAMWGGVSLMTMTLAGVICVGLGGRSPAQAFTTSLLRVDIWELSLPLIRQHPWFGTGFGSFQNHYEPYTIPHIDFLHHVHNFWLHLATEAGLPVMLLFTAIVGKICYRAMRYYLAGQVSPQAQPMLVGYGLGFLACILFSLFDIAFFDARINLLGWLMLAAIQAISDLVDQPNSTSTSPSSPQS